MSPLCQTRIIHMYNKVRCEKARPVCCTFTHEGSHGQMARLTCPGQLVAIQRR